jgi:membrane-bound lytic murein transglycosylase B
MPIISIKVPFYNWSSYYAMAVIELGQAVARAMAKAP